MKNFPDRYDFKQAEQKWQKFWLESGVYQWRDDKPREQTFVIDTPPPTVSGILHMGHVFSYTQADFIARYQRMSGKDVFYPMGFDDNGLPTERLVEKVKKVRPTDVGREKFIEICQEVVAESEKEFEAFFNSIALSVDWRQKYETISAESRKISQLSFLDLFENENVYRKYQPMYWDWVDQTAIAQAEIEEKELQGYECYIPFGIMKASDWQAGKRPDFASLEKVNVMTTRPELLGACVALMVNPSDEAKFKDAVAVSPLFNIVVPICFDEKVDKEKGTGFVMCCSWGDDTDKEWITKNNLAWRPLVGLNGRIDIASSDSNELVFAAGQNGEGDYRISAISDKNCLNLAKTAEIFEKLKGAKLVRDIKNDNSAKGKALNLLKEAGLLIANDKGETIISRTQMVKCAERSGSPVEIIPTYQWFIKLVDKKEQLKQKINECTWHPEYMKVRAEQWTDSLSWDWCISRQRYFGVPFPVWYRHWIRGLEEKEIDGEKVFSISIMDAEFVTIVAKAEDILVKPVDPLQDDDVPAEYEVIQREEKVAKIEDKEIARVKGFITKSKIDGKYYYLVPETDVMDTWATSSVSPQLSSKGISSKYAVDAERHKKLFPADMRPQAHEIIRTWAFYTIAKAMLHENTIPWHNLMISGWCLAEDKSKMSKSKGNVITPVPLVESKSSDVVRYWASTSHLGADTAYSEDVLKIGNKLVNKLWNATKFASINLAKLQPNAEVTETLDKWILTRLNKAIAKATEEFEQFEYCRARQAIEDFFWNDFCDNYLEMVKARSYDEKGEMPAAQQSALKAISICIDRTLRLFAPFVPHITEDLYNILSDGNQSIHSRGNWPKADLVQDENAEKIGIETVAVLELVRKHKSEKAVSVKFPIKSLQVSSELDLSQVAYDLKSVTSSDEISFAKGATSVDVILGEAAAA